MLIIGCFAAAYFEVARLQKISNYGIHIISLSLAFPWIIWAQFKGYSPWMIFALVLLLPIILYVWFGWREESKLNLPALSFFLGICFSYWILLERLGGFRLALFVFSIVTLHDIMAFVFGKLLGRFHPFPRLSPQKTVVGYLGGVLGAVVSSYIFWFAVPELNIFQVALAGVLLSVFSAAGDLFNSKIKRLYGVKDFSNRLGPMGGMLDRLDSLLSSAGVFYLYLVIIV